MKYALVLLSLVAGICFVPVLALAYQENNSVGPYNVYDRITTHELVCFNETPGEDTQCSMDWDEGKIIKSINIYWNGNDVGNGASFLYCPNISTFYYQFDTLPDAGNLTFDNLDMWCGQRIQIDTFDANFILTFTYYDFGSPSFGTATSSPFYIQDSGNLSFGLTILIVGMFLMVAGFMYNNLTRKKPWY